MWRCLPRNYEGGRHCIYSLLSTVEAVNLTPWCPVCYGPQRNWPSAHSRRAGQFSGRTVRPATGDRSEMMSYKI